MIAAGAPLRALFFVSWACTTCGLLCFPLLPPPVRKPPRALAALAWEQGLRTLWAELRGMYSAAKSHTLVVWSIWWVVGVSTNQIFSNYFQTQIYTVRHDAPFGLVEALMELASTAASAAASHRAFANGQSSTSTALGTSVLWAALCLASVVFAEAAFAGRLLLVCAANVAMAAVYALQEAVASASIARAASTEHPDGRFAMLFTLNSLAGLALATVVQAVSSSGQVGDVRTRGYYLLAFAQEVTLVLVLLACFRRRRGERKAEHDDSPEAYSATSPMIDEAEFEKPLTGHDRPR